MGLKLSSPVSHICENRCDQSLATLSMRKARHDSRRGGVQTKPKSVEGGVQVRD